MSKRSAVLSFEGGQLHIKLSGYGASNGEGEFIVHEDDLIWGDDNYRHLCIAPSEVIEIGKFIHLYLQQVEPTE